MSFLTEQYQNKSLDYFMISKTRKRNIIAIVGKIKNKAILDVGCGVGYLGEYYKNNDNYVVGLDVSNVAIAEAKKRLSDVYYVDLESNDWPVELLPKKFDLIILAELIEHLLMPEDLLVRIKKLLKPDGEIVITTPNFLVWSNRIKMLFGKFAYQSGGFWCRDHIHFFTLPELRKMLLAGGWEIVAENHLNHPKIPGWLNKLLPSLFAFQLIVKVKLKLK